MGLEYWPCYHSYRRKCEKLSDQELGRLFRALMTFSETGEEAQLAGRESIAFDFIADDIRRSREAYDARCETNRKNAEKRYGGMQSDTTACETCQTKTKDKDKTKDKSETKTKGEKPKGAERADRSPLETALDEVAKVRRAMKKPLTDKARELTVKELEKLAPGDEATQIAIINQSIQRGWQGVFPLKEDAKPKPKAKETRGAVLDDKERLARMLGVEG